MSDEDEMEEFGMNDEDLIRAFNPGSKRHKMSKEEAMLGIWASRDYSDSEDDLDEFSYKNQKKFSKSTVEFVSSKKPKKETTQNKDEPKKKDLNIIDEDEFQSFAKTEGLLDESDSDNDNMEELTTKNYYQVKEAKPSFRTSETRQVNKETVSKSEIKEIGNWEKHTKGIGMKLMQKMGWEKGRGLGKDLKGRAIPVEATVRKGKGAIGAHGPESKDVKIQRDEEEEEPVHVSQWKKDKKNKKPKYALRTPEELIQLTQKQPDKLKKIEQMLELNQLEMLEKKTDKSNKIKIIDMTGREQRVVHGYESLSHITKLSQIESREEKLRVNFNLPELTHNLDLILNMTEDRLIHYDKKTKHFEDMIVSLNYEEKRCREKINSEAEQIEKIKHLIKIIDECENKCNQENITLNELISIFQDLQHNYADEFIIYNLSQVSIPLLTPLLKRKMKLWIPFSDHKQDENCDEFKSISYCFSIYSELKNLLNETKYDNVNLYHRLVWETWMPAFRKNMSEISIKEYSIECSDLLSKWTPLLSSWIFQNILNQIIMPKLTSEVEEWNPLTDIVPIHEWIHPWLTLMKDRLDSTLFPTIRFKLANALQGWHPSDQSAKAILLPWKPPVFATQNWEQFIQRNILPKLEMVLENEFIINPNQQNLDSWNWVMTWFDIVPIANFVAILEKSFFPKWLKVLSVWLNSNPNYEEVSKWYVGWKSLFNDKLVQHPNIKAKLTQGLLMMNRSVSGSQVSYTPGDIAPTVTEKPTELSESFKQKGLQLSSTPAISSFKDIIERKAAELNIMFMPINNKFKEGKQIYRLGNLNMYLDRNVAFMLQNGNWIPSSISEIFQKAV